LRVITTGLKRWYGNRPLVTSLGERLDYESLIGGKSTIVGSLLVRHNDYARRGDVDGWDAAARISVNRPIGPSTLGSAWASIERNWANDPGQAFWREQLGVGILKEIGWGLRPQVSAEVTRQFNDGPLAPFDKQRRDWLLEGRFSLYKRNWSVGGFAPSFTLTATRNFSTLTLYDQERVRGEIRVTKAL
jgi:outer membrane protein